MAKEINVDKARSLMETYQHHLQVSPFDARPLRPYEAGYVVYKFMHNMFSAYAQSWRTRLLSIVLLRWATPHGPGAKVMANYFETRLHQLAHPGC